MMQAFQKEQNSYWEPFDGMKDPFDDSQEENLFPQDSQEDSESEEGEAFEAINEAASNGIVPISIEEELKRSYLDYAMSVIVSRALPDVRDGLKPVQRRILFVMGEENFEPTKPHKKSAKVIGQVIYKYHPHGDSAIYGALVRLAQDFSMRVCLVDGHGNFGSMDGDKAAAMRYTEVRLAPISIHLMEDYDKDTVDFQPNYDNTFEIPVVLPARFPNLLINGATGIAVGMATNIPPHHLAEVMDACCAFLDQPEIQDFSSHIKGPDFPTGGIILGTKGIQEAYATGRGSFLLRAKTHFETIRKDRQAIVLTEIPYQVNKADMVEKIARLVNEKTLEGISALRDESDREGVRVVVELKRDAIAEVVLNRLFTMTPMQISFNINMLALDRGRPLQMNLRDIIKAFVEFRKEVVRRRTHFFLRKARERAKMLMALCVALGSIDWMIALIKQSKDTQEALNVLMEPCWPLDEVLQNYLQLWNQDGDIIDWHHPRYSEALANHQKRLETLSTHQKSLYDLEPKAFYPLSLDQAKHILALRLQRLTGMERKKLDQDLKECHESILHLLALLSSESEMNALIKKEFLEIKEKFSTPRRTEIQRDWGSIDEEDLIQCEDMVVTVSLKGYIKRTPLKDYRSQKRGGRGRNAMDTREEDEVAQIFVADTHTLILVFTSMGKAYQLKVHELPMGSASARGKPLISLFPLSEGETLATLLPIPKDTQMPFIVFATSSGDVRKNSLKDFQDIRTNGKIAMKLNEGERLIGVGLVSDQHDILLSSHKGKSIRFNVGDLRQFSSRNSTGVRGISLKSGDHVVAMSVILSQSYSSAEIEAYRHCQKDHEENGESEEVKFSEVTLELPMGQNLSTAMIQEMTEKEEFLLSISEKGYGKRTSAYSYRCANRGGQGVATMDVTEKTGNIVNALPVKSSDDILLLTDKGQLLRCSVGDIRIAGRKTQGVKLFRLEADERVVSIAIFHEEQEV